ncbi:MAG: four helix bundle protein [Candidatus Wildermuthbacteria bacterium]|nr:four helix bundle protein [Candidatus Wildermuthbacteria bacterium]
MLNQAQTIKNPKPHYDLEERSLRFSNSVIDFARSIPRNIITNPLISQLVRAGTSIGANYCEADEASSKKDFINKIAIAKKETKETKYWIRTIVHAVPELKEGARPLWQEAQEFNLIFAAIIRNTKSNWSLKH